MVAFAPHVAVTGQQLERELHAVEAAGGPDVAAVGGGERLRVRGSRHGPGEQVGDVKTAGGGGPQCCHRFGQRGAGGGADGRVLVTQQILGLHRPGQQLGVQQQPPGVQLIPQAGGGDRVAESESGTNRGRLRGLVLPVGGVGEVGYQRR